MKGAYLCCLVFMKHMRIANNFKMSVASHFQYENTEIPIKLIIQHYWIRN